MPARRGLQRWLLVAVFACSAALYAATIDRGLDLGDYGDFQTVPYILGIAYPPGFPGYTLLGWLWSHGLPVGSVALRLNVLSVVAAAATNVSFAALLLELDVAPLAAAVAALLFGTTYQSWTHAGAASAHEVGTALLVASLFFAVRWVRSGHGYVLTSAATLYALSIATDSSTVLALPGLALIFSCRAPTKSERWLPALCACIVIAGAYAYLPLRSGYVATHGLDPTRALGLNEPDQFFDHHHPATLHNFVLLTTGAASGAPSAFRAMLSPHAILRTWNDFTSLVTEELGPLALVMGVVAVVVFLVRRGRIAVGIALVSAPCAWYMTSWGAESDVGRYVPRELLLLFTALAWSSTWVVSSTLRVRAIWGGALVLLVVWIAAVDTSHVSRIAQDRSTRSAMGVAAVLSSIPRDAIVLAPFTYAAPLAYAFYVEHRVPGAVVVCCEVGLLEHAPAGLLRRRPMLFLDRDTAAPRSSAFVFERRRTASGVALWTARPSG